MILCERCAAYLSSRERFRTYPVYLSRYERTTCEWCEDVLQGVDIYTDEDEEAIRDRIEDAYDEI